MVLFKQVVGKKYFLVAGVLLLGVLMGFILFLSANFNNLAAYQVYDGFAVPEKEMKVAIHTILNDESSNSDSTNSIALGSRLNDSLEIMLLQSSGQETRTWEFSSEEEMQKAVQQIQDVIQLSPADVESAQIISSEECSYAGNVFTTAAYFGEEGVQTTTFQTDLGVVVKQEGCNYETRPILVSSTVSGEDVVIVDADTQKGAAKISIEDGNIITISFSQNQEEEVSLSPAPLDHWADQKFSPELGEVLIDCGNPGDTGPVCDYGTAKLDKFPFFFWVLLLFNVFTLFYLNMAGSYSISKMIDKGQRFLKNKDFRKAIEQYNAVLKYYPSLREDTKDSIKESALNYYSALKKELVNAGIAVYKPLYPAELPELIYNDKKIGLMNIGHDSHRVEKLISDSLDDLKNGKKDEALLRKEIIDKMYFGLGSSEKKIIEKIYEDYLEKLGFR